MWSGKGFHNFTGLQNDGVDSGSLISESRNVGSCVVILCILCYCLLFRVLRHVSLLRVSLLGVRHSMMGYYMLKKSLVKQEDLRTYPHSRNC